MDALKGGTRSRAYVYRSSSWAETLQQRRQLFLCRFAGPSHSSTFPHPSGNHCGVSVECLEGFRLVGRASEVHPGIRHSGWFTDDDQRETLYGSVYQLPSRCGSSLFIAAAESSETDCHWLDCTQGKISTFDRAEDAARAANELARVLAEKERDYQGAWRAVEDARYDMQQARSDCSRLLGMLKAQAKVGPLAGPVCEDIRERFDAAREEMRDALVRLMDAKVELAREEARA